jgi:RecA-family ATPase
MKSAPDINDTLRSDGVDAVRAKHDKARRFNGGVSEPKPSANKPAGPDIELAEENERDFEPRRGAETAPAPLDDLINGSACEATPSPTAPLDTITPESWRGTPPPKQIWLAHGRIPGDDITILAGDGGTGKTEIVAGLLVSVAAGLSDWLGCVVETGKVLFLSCEEPEKDIRDRVERFSSHRSIDPYATVNLHMKFPDLAETWLATVENTGRVTKTPLMLQVEQWVEKHKPRLVVVDSIAAVFDGEAISRRQVRAFMAMLRKIARAHEVAFLLLDHPSVRGMADGSGTANSVDWRNSVRAMLILSGPRKDDPDARTLEVGKSNRGRPGEMINLRWNCKTFTTEAMAGKSPHRAQAERDIDELFLKLLDKRNAQGRRVHANSAKGSAPSEFAVDPEANGVTKEAFRGAMERLLTERKIQVVETGSPSKRRSHLERT